MIRKDLLLDKHKLWSNLAVEHRIWVRGKTVVRGSWLVKACQHTRTGCGQISLAGFPRGSPYAASMGPFITSRRHHGPCIFDSLRPPFIPIVCMRFRRSAPVVKNNIVYILCKDILYTLCKHIVYKFLLIEALIFLLNEDRCESDKPVSSGILAYLRQSSRWWIA